jgi:7,8-dihydropterin-6-yl-methyl-4-(beta-D-ribofuranosyl)aminobenzene 5'-phosphate synthase
MNALVLATIPLLASLGSVVEGAAQSEPSLQGTVTLTVLYDNTAVDERLGIGWGFAVLLETPDQTVLFDTGADGEALLENFRLLGKDPMAVDAIVISHAHGDHTQGLQALFDLGLRPRLYLLSAFPQEMREEIARNSEMVEAFPGQEIVPGIRTTGQVGTTIPEQALILDTQAGTVVLTGCAHPGVILMVERAQELSSAPLDLVMGGFHLMEAPAEEVQTILDDFRRLGVQRLGATHCTGEQTIAAMEGAYGEDFHPLGAGRVLAFSVSSPRPAAP